MPALQHLQFPVHDFAQPHWKRMEQALLLSSRVVQKGNHPPLLSLYHPQSWKSGMSWWTDVAWLQKLACNIALRMCWYRAACIGGKAYSVFFTLAKSRSLASLTLSRPQPLLYMTTTKRSSTARNSHSRTTDLKSKRKRKQRQGRGTGNIMSRRGIEGRGSRKKGGVEKGAGWRGHQGRGQGEEVIKEGGRVKWSSRNGAE